MGRKGIRKVILTSFPMSAKSISVSSVAKAIFPQLGLSSKSLNGGVFSGAWGGSGAVLEKYSPVDGSLLGRVKQATGPRARTWKGRLCMRSSFFK